MFLETFHRDLQAALRLWRSRPLLTLVVVFTLALGFSASSVIYSVVEAVLLEPLPYERPQQLLVVRSGLSPQGRAAAQLSGPEFAVLRDGVRSFSEIGAVWARPGVVGSGSAAAEIEVGWITPGFLEAFGVAPALGRLPDREEQRRTDVMVLSDALWRERFSADLSIVGRRVDFDEEPRTVVAVMPPGFRMHFAVEDGVPESMQAWLPSGADMATLPRTFRVFTVIGRAREGVTPAALDTELQTVASAIAHQSPDYGPAGFALGAEQIGASLVSRIRPALLIVSGVVAIVLVIAWTNVAVLLSILALQRAVEFSVRSALGASRGRLHRQVLTETALLAGAAAVLGIWLGRQGLVLLRHLDPSGIPRLQDAVIDGSTVALAALAAVAATLLTGWLALRGVLSRAPLPHQAIRGGIGSSGRANTIFVASQVALAVVLLAGAGLLVRSFLRLNAVDLGFDPSGVLSARVSLPDTRYRYTTQGPQIADFYRQLEAKLREIPGVRTAGATLNPPLSEHPMRARPYAHRTAEGDVPWGRQLAEYRTVTPGWFDAMGVRVVDGRSFDTRDTLGRTTAVIVDTQLAARAWPGRRAVGEPIRVEVFRDGVFAPEWGEVVGVVAPIRLTSLVGAEREQLYLPHAQAPQRTMFLAVRTDGDPRAAAVHVQAAVRALEPDLPVFEVKLASDYVAEAMSITRFAMTALGIFAGVALLLAGAGVFATMSASVNGRRREIGVRLALGASPARVFAWTMRQGLTVAGAGLICGLGGAVIATRALASLLFGVGPADVPTLMAVAAVVTILTAAACLAPAVRAARVDPCRTLRGE